MSLLDKFKEQFTDRDDEYEDEEYEEEGTSIDTAQPVPPRPAAGRAAVATRQAKPYTMVVVNPKDYQDAEKIGNHLKAARPVVMNMEKTDADEAQRIVDFIQGVIYLCAPNNMSVSRENFAAFPEAEAPAWDSQAPKA